MDRVDLRVEMHPVRSGAFAATGRRVHRAGPRPGGAARDAAAAALAPARRPHQRRGRRTAAAPPVPARTAAMAPLRTALDRGELSIRGVDRTLRVAWTLADLAGRTSPGLRRREHRAELSAGRECRDDRRSAAGVGIPVAGRRTAVTAAGGLVATASGPSRRPTASSAATVAEDSRGSPRPGATSTARQTIWRCSTVWVGGWSRPTTTSGRCWRSRRSAATRSQPAAGHAADGALGVGPARLADVAAAGRPIVGTRAATAYGEHLAADLAAGLAERDVAVVSGGAYGIDGAAHRAALAADGLTVAVLAGGIDVPYPAGHAALLRRIGQHGLLVSEYPPGVRPARHRFLTRNRLVAALPGRRWWSRRGCAAARPTPRRGRRRWAAWWARTRAGDLVGVRGLSRADEQRRRPRHPRRGGRRTGRVAWRTGARTSRARPRRSTGSVDAELRVYDALPARGAPRSTRSRSRRGCRPTGLLGPLAMLELAGLGRATRRAAWRSGRES